MLLDQLANLSGVSTERLKWLEENASKLYKSYKIPKKSGGERIISQPTPELKSVQRWIVTRALRGAKTSIAATAYKKGASIRSNASLHANTNFTAHFDFSDFFPSFTASGVEAFLTSEMGFSGVDARFVSKIVSRFDRLTIGAPSSPMMTNFMMYEFDESLLAWCLGNGLVYSRYADDINVSAFSPFKLSTVEGEISNRISEFGYASLKINAKKTAFLSRKYRREITGVTITPDHKVSIGRDRKRYIRHLVHNYCSGALNFEEAWRLGGLVAFAHDAEPTFVQSLERKYGPETVASLLHRKPGNQLNSSEKTS